MTKETYFFSHDYNARNDKKMLRLKQVHKMTGVGIYWCVVEQLYEEGGEMNLKDVSVIATELKVKKDLVETIIQDFDLFKNDGEKFWSDSVKRRLDKRLEKSEKAKASASHRWQNATAMRTLTDRNAIKERKGKENKGKERENSSASGFYEKQFTENGNEPLIENYRKVVSRLRGENDEDLVYKNIFSMREQLSYKQYVKLREKGLETNQDVFDILKGMENRPDVTKKSQSVYLTANNWINLRNKAS